MKECNTMFQPNRHSTAEIQKLPLGQSTEPMVQYRITVLENEIYRLPAGVRKIRVLSGTARVLLADHEIVVNEGEQKLLASRQDTMVIPVPTGMPLVLEMGLSASSPEQQQMKRLFYERLAQRQQIMEVEDQATKHN
jgi:hypothetical protein